MYDSSETFTAKKKMRKRSFVCFPASHEKLGLFTKTIRRIIKFPLYASWRSFWGKEIFFRRMKLLKTFPKFKQKIRIFAKKFRQCCQIWVSLPLMIILEKKPFLLLVRTSQFIFEKFSEYFSGIGEKILAKLSKMQSTYPENEIGENIYLQKKI